MEFTLIQNEKKLGSLSMAAFWLLVGALMFGIWVGPLWMGAIAVLGVLLATFDLSHVWILGNNRKKWLFPLVVVLLHGILAASAAGLYLVFIQPPPESLNNIPRFGSRFEDPSGQFTLVGPAGWNYASLLSKDAVGVKIIPAGRDAFGGVSDIEVWIRRMDAAPESGEKFIMDMAAAMNRSRSRTEDGSNSFSLKTRSDVLLGGHPGVISVLEAKKFWIPLKQVSLYGVKNGNYFCSITATGIKAHSDLAEVVCQGLFKTLEILE